MTSMRSIIIIFFFFILIFFILILIIVVVVNIVLVVILAVVFGTAVSGPGSGVSCLLGKWSRTFSSLTEGVAFVAEHESLYV